MRTHACSDPLSFVCSMTIRPLLHYCYYIIVTLPHCHVALVIVPIPPRAEPVCIRVARSYRILAISQSGGELRRGIRNDDVVRNNSIQGWLSLLEPVAAQEVGGLCSIAMRERKACALEAVMSIDSLIQIS